MIVNVEHIEATEREVIRSSEGARIVTSYTVTSTVEVNGVESMGDAVKRVEWRLTHGVPLSPPDPPEHVHQWADIPPLTSQLCSCGAMRRNEQ
jgi:hypothetical protein